jgi:DNA-binding MarR family transcriptional regulator
MSFPSTNFPSVTLTEDHITSILLVRRARTAILGENLFSDPAWDILLELYAASLGGRSVSVAELVGATETQPSTTVRWVSVLTDRGLVQSAADAARPGRLFVSITGEGLSRMEHLANHGVSAFMSIVVPKSVTPQPPQSRS